MNAIRNSGGTWLSDINDKIIDSLSFISDKTITFASDKMLLS